MRSGILGKSHQLVRFFVVATSWLVFASLPLSAAEIVRGKGICDISLTGDVEPGDAKKFVKVLKSLPSKEYGSETSLCLDSPGGNYLEAMAFIDAMSVEKTGVGVTTRIQSGAICASACALIFLGGSYNEQPGEFRTIPSRFLDVNSKGLGFHQPFLEFEKGNYDEGQVLTANAVANLQIAKLMALDKDDLFPKSLLAEALITGKDDLFFINTVQHAGRWSIKLTGFKVDSSRLTEMAAVQGCINYEAWDEGKESRIPEQRKADEKKEASGLRIFKVDGLGLEGSVSCLVAIDLKGKNQVNISIFDDVGSVEGASSIGKQEIYEMNQGFGAPLRSASASWELLPPSTKLSSLRSSKTATLEKSDEIIAQKPAKKTIATTNRSFQTFENSDTDGQLIEKHSSNNMADCQKSCATDADCASFTFNVWNKLCLKKGSATLKWLEPSSISGHLKGKKLPKTSSAAIGIQRYRGKKFPGSGYKTNRDTTEQSCFDSCSGDQKCIAYVFTRATQSCALLAKAGEYKSSADFDSGVKKQLN